MVTLMFLSHQSNNLHSQHEQVVNTVKTDLLVYVSKMVLFLRRRLTSAVCQFQHVLQRHGLFLRGRILLCAEDPSLNEPEGTRRAVLSELAASQINRIGEIKHLCRERYRQAPNHKIISSKDTPYFRNPLSSGDL